MGGRWLPSSESHRVKALALVFALPTPTIFQLSYTTADGRNVSADSLLA
jgi:hypothetical protein